MKLALLKILLVAAALAMAATRASAGFYVAEDECFGGTVPSTPVGLSAARTVNGHGGIYMVTAWRQPCQANPNVSVLLLKFQAVTGAPSISANDVSVRQMGLTYGVGMLVKDPSALLVTNWGQIGTFSTVNTIVWQGSGARFDANGELNIKFFDSFTTFASMTLAASPTMGPSASVDVFYGNVTDMWWNPAEDGMGMSIIQHGSNQLFVMWYTYTDGGEPLWIVFPGGTWEDSKTFSGALYKARGTGYSRPWDQSAFQIGASIGTGRLAFTAADRLTFTYTINGISGSRNLERIQY